MLISVLYGSVVSESFGKGTDLEAIQVIGMAEDIWWMRWKLLSIQMVSYCPRFFHMPVAHPFKSSKASIVVSSLIHLDREVLEAKE